MGTHAYYVVGGHYDDFSFESISKENYKIFGPFGTLQEAQNCWKAKSWMNVDDGQFRLEILDSPFADPLEHDFAHD